MPYSITGIDWIRSAQATNYLQKIKATSDVLLPLNTFLYYPFLIVNQKINFIKLLVPEDFWQI